MLVGLFFLLGTAVVLYAEGWRWDFSTWRPEKVGAILVRSFPEGARITLEGNTIANQAGILSESTLISGLLPRTYDLGLAEDGYRDWHENASVVPSLVTEFKDAVLVPQEPAVVSTDTVKNFVSASGELIIQTQIAPTQNDAIVWRGTMLAHGTIVGMSTNLKTLVIKNAAGIYELYDFGSATTTNLSAALARGGARAANITSVMVDPYDATTIIASGARRIWIFDATQATTTIVENAPAGVALGTPIAASPSLLAWTRFNAASSTSAVVLYDKFSKTAAVSSSTIPGTTQKLAWIGNSLLGAAPERRFALCIRHFRRHIPKIGRRRERFRRRRGRFGGRCP